MTAEGRRQTANAVDGASHQDDEIRPPSERSFAAVFTVVFAAVGGYQIHAGRTEVGAGLIAAAAVLVAAALLRPSLLAPANRAWFRFGLMLNRIVAPLVMFAVFAITIVPIGLVMRLIGHDPLRRRFDPKAPTYWIERSPPGPDSDSMRNQF